MKKIIYMAFSLLFLHSALNAQEVKGKTFEEIKKEKEVYFKELESKYGHKYLEDEAGEYMEYKRWLRVWGNRLKPGETIESYIKNISDTNRTFSMRTGAILDPWTELGPNDQPVVNPTGIGPIQYITFL